MSPPVRQEWTWWTILSVFLLGVALGGAVIELIIRPPQTQTEETHP